MNTATRKPDLFLVGAPKSGTTAIYAYLQRHPDVFMSTPKEPQFFAEDIFRHQRNITSLPAYMDCFGAAKGQKWAGEASVAYLGSPQAAREIKSFSPRARIVIILRNPVDVMHAQHSERRFAGTEHIRDFEAALDSREERKWRSGPFKGQKVIRLSYRDLARYAEPVARYFDAFDRENIHVILYDDFRSNASAAFDELLRFLGVRPPVETEYEVLNKNRRARSAAVQSFVNDPPKFVRSAAGTMFPQSWRSAVGKTVRRWNAVYGPRPPMSPQLRLRLQMECKPDVEALGKLLGRDLSCWWQNCG